MEEYFDHEKRQRDIRHLLLMGMLAIVLMTALILALARFRSIRVVGNTRYTEEEVADMIFSDPWDTNAFYQFIKERTRPHKSIPFIQEYDIHWNGPLDVEIIVYEKNVVGYVDYMSSHMYFDKDGIIVESTEELLPGVPRIQGLRFGSIVLYRPLPVSGNRVFNSILNLTGSLHAFGIDCDSIEYDELLHATVHIGGIDVLLGTDADMEMKVSLLNDMLPKLEGMQGQLDLSQYSERSEREAYIFKEKR